MRHFSSQEDATLAELGRRRRWRWLLVSVCALVLLVGLLRLRRHPGPASASAAAESALPGAAARGPTLEPVRRQNRPAQAALAPARSPEEIVAGKLAHFAQSRRELAHALAQRQHVPVSPDVERFFDAVASGKWEEIQAAYEKMKGGELNANSWTPEVKAAWSAIKDAYGAAEQVHLWPAQKLLDYGNTILDALRPGMVYVGGTDPGRWIPELLNDTSDGERHVMLTQNALADGQYVDYLKLQYAEGLSHLTEDESKSAFEEYLQDAQRRFEHDQEFPNEPKQVRPGEDIHKTDGNMQVGGQVAVMAINELLLLRLMRKNPDTSFALEESFPLKNTYADALPLGPLMELRARDDQNPFTADRAAQSLDYWRNRTQEMLSDADAVVSPDVLKSYSHDAVAAANLLAAHSYDGEAEEAYRLAARLWPENAGATTGLAGLFADFGREGEARQLLDDFARKYPDLQKGLEQSSAATRLRWTATMPKR
jgi:hypothetical protein